MCGHWGANLSRDKKEKKELVPIHLSVGRSSSSISMLVGMPGGIVKVASVILKKS